MEEYKREFKGIWIPREVYLSEVIGWTGKLIYLEIDSFTARDKDCFVSNEYLAKKFEISERMVTKYINQLKTEGWITQTRFDGKKRYLRTCYNGDFSAPNKSSSLPINNGFDEVSDPDSNKSSTLASNESSMQDRTKVQDSPEQKFDHTINTITNKENTINNTSIPYVIEVGEEKKPEPPKKGKGKTKKPADPSYTEMMKIYYEWYQGRNGGTPPKIDGAEGNALKSIIVYFRTIYNSRPEPKKSEFEELCGMWHYLFNNWAKLDNFHQKNLKLTQINSNITNMIDYLKNGRATQKQNLTDKSPEARTNRLSEAVELARAKVNGGQPHGV